LSCSFSLEHLFYITDASSRCNRAPTQEAFALEGVAMMKRSSLLMTVALALAGEAGLADAADVAAGKAKVDAICAECHEAADWQGSGEAELAKLIDGVAKGTSKHPKKKLELTDADVANIAAYWASAAK